jgi:hypothetical protein
MICIDLNLIILNSLPHLPILGCIKKTGPFEFSLIKYAINNINAKKKTKPTKEKTISNTLLIIILFN